MRVNITVEMNDCEYEEYKEFIEHRIDVERFLKKSGYTRTSKDSNSAYERVHYRKGNEQVIVQRGKPESFKGDK